jgi:hypothetical protein
MPPRGVRGEAAAGCIEPGPRPTVDGGRALSPAVAAR